MSRRTDDTERSTIRHPEIPLTGNPAHGERSDGTMTGKDDTKTHKLVVQFTQQQRELLERLLREGTFGNTYGEVVANVFREFVKQQAGKAGA